MTPSSNAEIYRLRADAYDTVVGKRLRTTRLFLFGLAVLLPLMFVVNDLLLGADQPATSPVLSIGVWSAVALLLGGVLLLADRRGRAKARQAYDSYELTLGDDTIRRVHVAAEPLELTRREVCHIYEHPTFGLRVTPADKYRSIDLPPHLERYEQARERLRHWQPIEPWSPGDKASLQIVPWAMVALWLGCCVATARIQDLRWAAAPGLGAIAVAAWVWRVTARSRMRRTVGSVLIVLWMASPLPGRLFLQWMNEAIVTRMQPGPHGRLGLTRSAPFGRPRRGRGPAQGARPSDRAAVLRWRPIRGKRHASLPARGASRATAHL